MPIPFACPHCGTQSDVPDQYAGQTGPCAVCGKTITIPRHSAAAAAVPMGEPVDPPARSGAPWLLILSIALGVFLLCGGGLAALVVPAINVARSAARSATSQLRLTQVAMA